MITPEEVTSLFLSRYLALAAYQARLAEREACANVAADGKYDFHEDPEGNLMPCVTGTEIAAAIRARS